MIGVGVGISGTTIVGLFTPFKPSVPVEAIAIAVGVSGEIGLIFGVQDLRNWHRRSLNFSTSVLCERRNWHRVIAK
ncbi:MAG: hypothetical protein V7K40_27480 [Nostoc sp.]|uniref:hypothetical protein n=1 Tax=Nostoc sp. TaxID=1180 RepID=UPI002FFA289E